MVRWVGLLLLSWSTSALGGNSATQLIKKGEQILRGRSNQAHMQMAIVRPGFRRDLEIRIWAQGKDQALVEILAPSKETGTASLRVHNQMWNYLPKTEQTIRVPSSMMLQSWMGSDFTNDDLVKASSLSRDYRHRFHPQTHLGKNQKLIVCTPRPGAPVVWGKILYYARTRDGLPLKQEYFDENQKLVRTLTFSRFRRMDDRIIPTRIEVSLPEAPGETTVVTYRKALYDRKLPSGIFNKDRLRQSTEQGRNVASLWGTRPLRVPRGKVTYLASQRWGVGR